MAAAASASRRSAMGVEPECASWPWKVMAWRSTPLVPRTAASGSPRRFEYGPLLDVEFEVGGDVAAFGGRIADAFDVDLALPQGVFEADAVAIGAGAIGLNGVRAGEGGGPEEAAAEARAFLVGPVHQANGEGRPAVEVLGQSGAGLRTR